MKTIACFFLLGAAAAATALPTSKNHLSVTPEAYRDPALFPCTNPYCKAPNKKYSRVLNVKPRIQWDDSGGYCGSLAIQNVALGKGVWVSQAVIRNSTVDAGGHTNQGGKGHEILAGNIDLALKTMKLKHEGFDWKTAPVPQADAYRAFIKRNLVAGHGVAWMIMLRGGQPVEIPQKHFFFRSNALLIAQLRPWILILAQCSAFFRQGGRLQEMEKGQLQSPESLCLRAR